MSQLLSVESAEKPWSVNVKSNLNYWEEVYIYIHAHVHTQTTYTYIYNENIYIYRGKMNI